MDEFRVRGSAEGHPTPHTHHHKQGLAFLHAALPVAPTPLGVKIAFNMAAKVGDVRALLACLRLARAQASVDPWMLQEALLVRGVLCSVFRVGCDDGV